jgi:hypothetical protein
MASSTATDSTDDSSEDESTDGTDGGLLPALDFCGGGFRCQTSCNQFDQDCPEGEKCTAYASSGETWDAEKCVIVHGDLEPGEPCTYDGRAAGTDDCGPTSMCYGGICQAYCGGTAADPVCPAGFGCTSSGNEALTLCLASCDPLAQDCAVGSCYSHNEQFLCNPSGSIESGQPCGLVNDCAPGNACVEAELVPGCVGSACCSPFCNLEQPDCTTPGTECVAWFEPGQAPAGLERVGVCLSP